MTRVGHWRSSGTTVLRQLTPWSSYKKGINVRGPRRVGTPVLAIGNSKSGVFRLEFDALNGLLSGLDRGTTAYVSSKEEVR